MKPRIVKLSNGKYALRKMYKFIDLSTPGYFFRIGSDGFPRCCGTREMCEEVLKKYWPEVVKDE